MPQALTRFGSVVIAPVPTASVTSEVSEKPLGGFTVTDVDAEPLPLYMPPVHASVYVAVPEADGVTLSLPETAFAPVQPPLAVHVVPTLEVHVSVVDWPSVIVVGDALSVTVGW